MPKIVDTRPGSATLGLLVDDYTKSPTSSVAPTSAPVVSNTTITGSQTPFSTTSVAPVSTSPSTKAATTAPTVNTNNVTPTPSYSGLSDKLAGYVKTIDAGGNVRASLNSDDINALAAAGYQTKGFGTTGDVYDISKMSAPTPAAAPVSNYMGSSVVDYLKSLQQDSSFTARQQLARSLGINNYIGTADQNTTMLDKLRENANTSSSSNTSGNTDTGTSSDTSSTSTTGDTSTSGTASSAPDTYQTILETVLKNLQNIQAPDQSGVTAANAKLQDVQTQEATVNQQIRDLEQNVSDRLSGQGVTEEGRQRLLTAEEKPLQQRLADLSLQEGAAQSGVSNSRQALADAVAQQQRDEATQLQEVTLAKDLQSSENPTPVSLSRGAELVNPKTGAVIAQGAPIPEVKSTKNGLMQYNEATGQWEIIPGSEPSGNSAADQKAFYKDIAAMTSDLEMGKRDWGEAYDYIAAAYPDAPSAVIDKLLNKDKWAQPGAYEAQVASRTAAKVKPTLLGNIAGAIGKVANPFLSSFTQ